MTSTIENLLTGPPGYYSMYDGGTETFTITPTLQSETFSDAWATTAEVRLDRMREEVHHELDTYSRYGPGWDGYDGLSFEPRFLSVVSDVADRLVQSFRVAHSVPTDVEPGPASDGSVDIECAVGPRRLFMTFYPDSPNQIIICWPSDSKEREMVESIERFRVEDWVSWLLGESSLPVPVDKSRSDS